MKDNFEGGATWAYEVGSQSMVCPIIVEDLNQPRQMLVEVLHSPFLLEATPNLLHAHIYVCIYIFVPFVTDAL